MSKSILIFFLISLIQNHSTTATSQYILNNSSSSIQLNGTSTMHDWEAMAHQMSGKLITAITSGELEEISGLQVSVTVESIKSDNSKLNDKMHESLKEKDFPKIKYTCSDYSINGSTISLIGDLTIAGITRSVEILIDKYTVGDEIKFSGHFNVKMTDFEIKPPTLFLGTIKTGDSVAINFHLVFDKKN